MPVRRIRPNSRSTTGKYPICRRLVAYESQLERDFLVLLSAEVDVAMVEEQPVRIPYALAGGRASHYTPDFLVTYSDRQPELVEIKYQADVLESWPELRLKCRAAARWAKDQGYRFHLVTERHVHGPRLENLTWLQRYRGGSRGNPLVADILAQIASQPNITVGELLIGDTAGRLATALWSLLADRLAHADLNFPLSLNTSVRIL